MHKETSISKYVIVSLGIGIAVLAIVFGSILPMAKAKRYIKSVRNLSQVRSMEQFKINFDAVLNFYSPIGDEETGKFLGNEIFGAVNNTKQPEEVSRALVDYIEPRLMKDNVRHLLLVGRMYYAMWMNFKKESDFAKSEEMFLRAHEIGPRLPNPLYGLLDLYQRKGEKEKARITAEEILKEWPTDKRIQGVLMQK
ncbi:MAG: hypothetical protein AAB495_03585 [Patescibacteria group bacterium]